MTDTHSTPTEIMGSRQLPHWLAEQNVSLAFTTYQTGKLFLIGTGADRRLWIFERTFNRAMGLCATLSSLYLSSLYQLWRFENALEPGQIHEGCDRLYVPQISYITGDLDIHDIAIDKSGQIIFVNTLFGCLATMSATHSFIPLWKPPFISKLAAEDRCHLNGLAMENGEPRYVSMVSQTDIADGWRDRRVNGGCIMDVTTNEVVLRDLSMPHSPRWYRDKLWLLNSGTGYFGYVDRQTGQFEPVTFCPGYLRGLAFAGDFAIVGLSKPRHNKTFMDLPLDETLKAKDAEARCGLQVIDLRTGDIVHWLRIDGYIEEMYDVAVLPNVRRPMALGFKTDEIRRVITIGDSLPT
ncbi:MAG: TIGR03032 family protein [Roseofilum sp. SBFL]|uniref:TIGR03032 family protein n=1 Tax=unclassified Roseofilum TaxID=2620099 RepID=UPI001B1822B0|nr:MULTISPECIES: TIGR03032 family protein [unclassified Roseofilum]MBP0013469.1 TIGR03032 family protein [Roseofilum sp. SID3]MBP0024666.1 TIGR03032 family protein [Roseofilum sp. SID2]MBP0039474.1 TIGR03032 family protein [Roseofilum sp. SID1]MBP0042500.1 TIGR03032 family protein [Roseofilum sp. SBFL]